tara:strand:- start:1100 stop:1756 length:657 start_codon:yes stop_codon:yes gene_type:complete
MIAKITHITGNGHYDSPHGRLFKQLYVFDDNVEVSANHKTEKSPFKIGDEVDYEINGTNSYGAWGRVRRPDQDGKYSKKSVTVGGGRNNLDDDRSVVIERSWAMGQAISMMGVLPSRNDSAIDAYFSLAGELAKTILSLRDTFPHYKEGVFESDTIPSKYNTKLQKDMREAAEKIKLDFPEDKERPSDAKWTKEQIEAMDIEAEKADSQYELVTKLPF